MKLKQNSFKTVLKLVSLSFHCVDGLRKFEV